MSGRKLILAEFNELCPWLIERWMDDGKLPNFRRLQRQSATFTTRADVDDPVNLEPWIQWYSLHTGLPFAKHGVFHLTEGAKARDGDIWRAAAAAGKRVMCFASMNARPFDFPGSVFVADPWCEDGNAHPPALNAYNRFVASQVREYSNPDQRLSARDVARFGWFMSTHGLSASTLWAVARQLASERIKDRRLSWRRAALLDRMQFDVFRRYQRKTRPDLSTFFINSTAHFQHSYWRHFDPQPFTAVPGREEAALYGEAMLFGYQAMDRLLAKFMALAEETGAMLVLLTALSQQPYTLAEASGGKHFYRLRDVECLFRSLGLAFDTIDPTMTHQYFVSFATPVDRKRARAALSAFKMSDGRALFDFNARTRDGLYFSCTIDNPVEGGAMVTGDDQPLRFFDLLYKIDATKSGRHHPDGALWIATGVHRVFTQPVSILDVFPTALDLMDIPREGFGDRPGVSLAEALG